MFKDSLLLCDLSHRNCEAEFSYIDAKMALLLHLVVMTETPICCAHHSKYFLWDASNRALVSSSLVSMYLLPVLVLSRMVLCTVTTSKDICGKMQQIGLVKWENTLKG
jgi:hypothetical protein